MIIPLCYRLVLSAATTELCNVYESQTGRSDSCSGASHYMRRGSQRHNIPDGVKTTGSFLWPNS